MTTLFVSTGKETLFLFLQHSQDKSFWQALQLEAKLWFQGVSQACRRPLDSYRKCSRNGRCGGSRVCQACGYSSSRSLRATGTELVTYFSLFFTMFALSLVVLAAPASVLSPEAHEYNLGIQKRLWLLVDFWKEAAPILMDAGVVHPTQIPLTGSVFLPVKWEMSFFMWGCGLILKCHLKEGRWSSCCLGKNS